MRKAILSTVFTLVFWFGYCCLLIAQDLPFQHFTVNNGLPSSDIYAILQDRQGYIWMGTSKGAVRYDGNNFQVFTTEDGLTGNDIIYMYQDSKERIWFLPFKRPICYYYKDSVFTPNLMKGYENVIKLRLLEDSQENLWVSLGYAGVFRINAAGEKHFTHHARVFFENDSSRANVLISIDLIENKKQRVIQSVSPFGTLTIQGDSSEYHPFEGPVNRTLPIYTGQLENGDALFYRNGLQQCKSHDCKLFVDTAITQQTLLSKYRSTSYLTDKNGGLWIGTKGGVVHFLKRPNKDGREVIVRQYLPNRKISCLMEDRQGNIWIGTEHNGYYFLSNNAKNVYQYSEKEGLPVNNATILDGRENRVMVGFANGFVGQLYDEQFILKETSQNLSQKLNVLALLSMEDGSYWYSDLYGCKVNKGGKQFVLKMPRVRALEKNGKDVICAGGDSYIMCMDRKKLFKFYEQNHTNTCLIYSYDHSYHELIDQGFVNTPRINDIHFEHDSQVWVGTYAGLYTLDKDSLSYFDFEDQVIMHVRSNSAGWKWMATKESGVIGFKADSIVRINTEQGLSSNACNKLYIDKQNRIWVATNKGVNLIRFLGPAYQTPQITNFSYNDGLPSNEVNDILVTSEKVYAATVEGLAVFDTSVFQKDTIAPPVYITNLSIWNKDTILQPHYQFNYQQNQLRIGFIGLAYNNHGSAVTYQYQLEGFDQDWQSTAQTSIPYPNLLPGDYTFKVYAVNASGVKSKAPAVISFSIAPPFWRTWWFVLLCIAAGALLLWWLFNSRIKRIQRKAQIQREMNELQKKALQMEINPHFMANTMNSIQYYIIKNDQEKAIHYLGEFSALMRLTLHRSRNEYVSLRDEINSLKLYLSLEALRFEDRFEYDVKCLPELDADECEVPPMLLQPYAENAVIHGLANKKEKGKIMVIFSKEEGQLVCEIIDNGIGREAAASINQQRRKGHQSIGMSNAEQRLKIMDIDKTNRFQVQVIDLYDEQRQACGTKVRVRLPFKAHQEAT